MGKPFFSELSKISDTLLWAFNQAVEDITKELLDADRKPLFIVGSGGSLSACHFLALLYQEKGMMAKAITPLELFYSRHSLRKSNIIFISASGKNSDILFGYRVAINYEPNRIYSICMKRNTPLKTLSDQVTIGRHFEFNLPTGKDGFLATNSLVAFFAILYKSVLGLRAIPNLVSDNKFKNELNSFFEKVDQNFTFLILYAGWGQPVGIDLESKLAEAALGNVLISDYRNFGHGRHHWFDKRGQNAAIISIVTPEEKEIASKTLSLLPDFIPVLNIESSYNDPISSLDLLIKSFDFVNKLGSTQQIDPGRPGVPDYGSKLYHLNYKRFYRSDRQDLKKIAITRKADVPVYEALSEDEKLFWSDAYDVYLHSLNRQTFGIIIFDYDGTICSQNNRYKEIDAKVADALNELLAKGVTVGIATGRGKSVREALQQAINEKFWPDVIIGYYNCGQVATLENNNMPDINKPANLKLERIMHELSNYKFPSQILPELRPNQLVIEIKDLSAWAKVRMSIIQVIIGLNIPGIQILESSHSMDVIDQEETNKLNIINHCISRAHDAGSPEGYLCLGDKGKWPGNDYQLLSTPYSLSVDEVSSLTNSCWNLAEPGIKNVDATLYYLSCIDYKSTGFQLII